MPSLASRIVIVGLVGLLVAASLVIHSRNIRQSLAPQPPPPPPLTPTSIPAPLPNPASAPPSLAETIIYREGQMLNCGIDESLPGFSTNEQGSYQGLYIDYCKAIAITLFGDYQKGNQPLVDYIPITGTIRNAFQDVASGALDVVFTHTTLTFNRDIGEGIDFGPVIFHDGQGIVVRKEGALVDATDINDLTFKTLSICVPEETTSLLNLPSIAQQYTMTLTFIRTTPTLDAAFAALAAKQCDAVTDVRSALAAKLTKLGLPATYQLLGGGPLSRDPIAPFFKENDSRWAETANWVVHCTLAAEELGITMGDFGSQGEFQPQETEAQRKLNDPRIRRLLGLGDDRLNASNPGLLHDSCRRIIAKLGNYGEIYRRNLDGLYHITDLLEVCAPAQTACDLVKRGPNKLWKDGGLLYAPIFE